MWNLEEKGHKTIMGVEGQKGGGEGKRKGSRVNRSKKHYMTV
jgi:hypothetical protein